MRDAENKKGILEKINELQNNLFDNMWNMVYKQYKTDAKEVKVDQKKNIDKYLKELNRIVNENDRVLSDIVSETRGLIYKMKDMLDPIDKLICKVKRINKKEVETLENILKKDVNNITKSIRQIAGELSYE